MTNLGGPNKQTNFQKISVTIVVFLASKGVSARLKPDWLSMATRIALYPSLEVRGRKAKSIDQPSLGKPVIIGLMGWNPVFFTVWRRHSIQLSSSFKMSVRIFGHQYPLCQILKKVCCTPKWPISWESLISCRRSPSRVGIFLPLTVAASVVSISSWCIISTSKLLINNWVSGSGLPWI